MTLSLLFAPIPVTDADEALAFYRDALGLTLANDVAANGGRWITFGDDGGPQVVLSTTDSGRSKEDAAALEELVVKGSLGPWGFSTDDLQATFDRAVAAGAEVVSEPTDQPWGPRDAGLRDPSGNMIRILQA